MDTRKVCPLGGLAQTCGQHCAWYVEEQEKCAMLILAENINEFVDAPSFLGKG